MSQQSRRKVLKGFVITLPATWTTPVIQSVVLPAHAGVSGETSTTPDVCGPFCGTQDADDFVELTVESGSVNLRGCNAGNEFTGSGTLSGLSFNFQTTLQNWAIGSINSDCSGASLNFCIDSAGSTCATIISLGVGSCGTCGDT